MSDTKGGDKEMSEKFKCSECGVEMDEDDELCDDCQWAEENDDSEEEDEE